MLYSTMGNVYGTYASLGSTAEYRWNDMQHHFFFLPFVARLPWPFFGGPLPRCLILLAFSIFLLTPLRSVPEVG